MPYGWIPLGASIILTFVYLFTEAAWWSKGSVVGLLLVSLACYAGLLPFPLFGLLLRVALCIFIALYLKAQS
jgi:multisubunit Na+/H+ antiporter MnhE subunit